MAQSHGLTEGRRMRVDTTVVETNIHYPTDSSLLGDGVRVLTRTMKKITKIVGAAGTKLRDRSRSVKLRVLDIARAARSKAKQGQEKLKRAYRQLLNSTSRVADGLRGRYGLGAHPGLRHRDRRARAAGTE
jgi:IS5 family transposase